MYNGILCLAVVAYAGECRRHHKDGEDEDGPDDEDTIYQIVDLLVDTCATNRKLLRIAGDDKPAEVVRSRFMKLNADHIRFVLKCLAENSNPIRNMKQYLLASLYNAPTTMQLSYQNQANHDLAMRR